MYGQMSGRVAVVAVSWTVRSWDYVDVLTSWPQSSNNKGGKKKKKKKEYDHEILNRV